MFVDTCGCYFKEVLLASSGQRPEIMLNILQYIGQSPSTKNYVAPEFSSVKDETVSNDEISFSASYPGT